MSEEEKINIFVWLIWRFLPPCKDITSLISHSKERHLSFREKAVLKIHIWSCLACRRYAEQIQYLERVFEVERQKEPDPGPELKSDAAERIKAALKSRQY